MILLVGQFQINNNELTNKITCLKINYIMNIAIKFYNLFDILPFSQRKFLLEESQSIISYYIYNKMHT